jgi:hypoxanthine phosphoribosyltransferase
MIDIGWDAYAQALDTLVTKVINKVASNSNFRLSILGVARGGLFPAVALSHALPDSQFDTLRCSSYDGMVQLPEVTLYPPASYTMARAPERVLVVDDLIDTGKTMVTISNWLEHLGFVRGAGPGRRFGIAVVYDKVRPERAIQADIVGQEMNPEEWIKFPYERRL